MTGAASPASIAPPPSPSPTKIGDGEIEHAMAASSRATRSSAAHRPVRTENAYTAGSGPVCCRTPVPRCGPRTLGGRDTTSIAASSTWTRPARSTRGERAPMPGHRAPRWRQVVGRDRRSRSASTRSLRATSSPATAPANAMTCGRTAARAGATGSGRRRRRRDAVVVFHDGDTVTILPELVGASYGARRGARSVGKPTP